MPRPRKASLKARLHADWKALRKKTKHWIQFRKLRYKRFLEARKARKADRLERRTASSLQPQGSDVRFKEDSDPSKIKRIQANLRSEVKESREGIRRWFHFKWQRIKHFFKGMKTWISDLPSLTGFTKYLLHRRRKNIRDQDQVATRKAKAKASGWNKFRRIYLPEWFRRWTTERKPLSVLLTVALLFTIGIGLAAYPMYGWLKTVRAEQLLEESRELHEQEEFQEAFRKAHASYMLNPNPIETLRWLCETAESIKYRELLSWRLMLVRHAKSTPEDRIKLVRTALAMEEPQLAEETIRGINADRVESMEYLHLNLLTTLAQGRPAKNAAIAQCRKIMKFENAPLAAHRIYWSLCLDNMDPRFAKEAMDHMKKTSSRSDDRGLAALQALLQVPAQNEDARERYARAIWKHPLAQRHDRLLGLRAVYFGQPLPENALRAALGDKYDRLEESELEEITATLNDLGLHENVAALLPVRDMNENKALWIEWLRARFGTEGNLEEQWDQDASVPFSKSERHFLHSLVLRKSGETEEANKELETALSMASSGDLPLMRKFVLLHEDKQTLVDLLYRLAKEPEMERWAKALLMVALRRGTDAEPLEELLLTMKLEDYRRDPQTANQISRLKALHGQEIAACRKLAESLVAQYPEINEYRFTLALCYQASGRTAESLRLLEGIISNSPNECPTQRLIGARALSANGFANEAENLVQGFEKIRLLPSERQILSQVLEVESKTELNSKIP
ncbi:MAG: hypothetical protein CMI30_02475 [Opitutae bacterium]|nr:hypothetical protein [Opitutae bacterium]